MSCVRSAGRRDRPRCEGGHESAYGLVMATIRPGELDQQLRGGGTERELEHLLPA